MRDTLDQLSADIGGNFIVMIIALYLLGEIDSTPVIPSPKTAMLELDQLLQIFEAFPVLLLKPYNCPK